MNKKKIKIVPKNMSSLHEKKRKKKRERIMAQKHGRTQYSDSAPAIVFPFIIHRSLITKALLLAFNQTEGK